MIGLSNRCMRDSQMGLIWMGSIVPRIGNLISMILKIKCKCPILSSAFITFLDILMNRAQ